MLETAIADRYLEPKLDADTSLADITYQLRTTTTTEPMPMDRVVVLVKATEGPVTITGLHDAVLDIQVGVHQDVELAAGEDPVLIVKTVEKAIEKAFSKVIHPNAKTEFTDAIEAEDSDYTGGDFFVRGWRTEEADATMKQIYTIDCGVLLAGL